jgi:hypothetical protein
VLHKTWGEECHPFLFYNSCLSDGCLKLPSRDSKQFTFSGHSQPCQKVT